MATIKFHLDQHVPNAVAHGLRQYGVDVTTTHEAGLQDADDVDHLAFASEEGRVLVTHDSDFVERHGKGEPHAGLCYAPQAKYQRRVAELLQSIHLVYACLSAEDMVDHLEYMRPCHIFREEASHQGSSRQLFSQVHASSVA